MSNLKKDFVSTWSHLRFRQEKTSKPKDTVGQLKYLELMCKPGLCWIFVLGALAMVLYYLCIYAYSVYVNICLYILLYFLDLGPWVAVSNLSMFNPYSWYFASTRLKIIQIFDLQASQCSEQNKTTKTLPRFWQIATEELQILCSILVPMNYHKTYTFQVLISHLSILVALKTLFLQRFW